MKQPTCRKHPHVKLICPACAAEQRKTFAGGRPPIEDEFSDRPVSRQRKHQLRKEREERAKQARRRSKSK